MKKIIFCLIGAIVVFSLYAVPLPGLNNIKIAQAVCGDCMSCDSSFRIGDYCYGVTDNSCGGAGGSCLCDCAGPAIPAPPTPTISLSGISCINNGYDGTGINISWANNDTPVTYVDISATNTFSPFYNKAVSGSANTAVGTNGTGFGGGFPGYNPNTLYYVRLYNGTHSPTATFGIPLCPPSAPTGLTASCPSPGTTANLSWNSTANATYYALRVNNTTTGGWNNTCNASTGDFCSNEAGTSRSFSSTAGNTYGWWLHACNSAGGCSDPTNGPNFTCLAPPPTGRISIGSSGSLNCDISGRICWGYASDQYSFTAVGNDANSKLNKVEIWAAKTDGTDWGAGVSCPAGINTSNPKWCLLKSRTETTDQATFSLSSGNWKAPAAGKYYIVINAYNSFPANNSCSGNPMEALGSGWTRCSNNNEDYIELDLFTPAPTITSLQVGNDDANQTGNFSGSNRVIGLTQAEKGSNWLNPMKITVDATPVANIKSHYVAFYNKSGHAAVSSTASETAFLDQVKAILNNNPKEGFLLRYDSNGTYYVWDPYTTSWVNVTSNTKSIGSLYTVSGRNPTAASWRVKLNSAFGSKTMYTAVMVVDKSTPSKTTVNPDITPTY